MHLDSVMIVKILLFSTAYADGSSSDPECEISDEVLAVIPNPCKTPACNQGSISLCDICKRNNDRYSIACICGEYSCLAVKLNGMCRNDCTACLNAFCETLTSTEQPITDIKSVYSNSTTISSTDYSHTRNSTQHFTQVNSIPQSNGPMNDNHKSVEIGVGVGVGLVAAVALVLIAAFLIFRHVRRRKRASAQGVTNTTTDYQEMTTAAPTTPVAPYENLMKAPSGEQIPEPTQQIGSGFNNRFNGETSYENAGRQIHSHDVSGTSGRVGLFGAVAPPGESGETTLLDNEFYGDNASNIRSNNANEGETTVIDNDFYE